MRSYLVALGTLTVLPVPLPGHPTALDLARSRYWYPVVGLVLGVILAGMTALAGSLGSPFAGAFLVVAAWVGVTGGLHLDGVGGVGDALPYAGNAEDRLRIMKDPHLGTFGLIGVVLVLLGKFAAVVELIAQAPDTAPAVVLVAAVVARALVLVLAAGSPYPRPAGTGKIVVESTTWFEARLALLGTAALIALLTPVTTTQDSVFLLVALWGSMVLAVFGLRLLCIEKLGGVTGDCLGAGIELVEVLFLVLAALLG